MEDTRRAGGELRGIRRTKRNGIERPKAERMKSKQYKVRALQCKNKRKKGEMRKAGK
jgi:hypothetical protein